MIPEIDLPFAVQLNLNGMPVTYLNIDTAKFPDGVRLALTRPGSIAPEVDGIIPAGGGLLAITPDVHRQIRAAMASEIRRAEAAAGVRPS